VTLTTRGPKEDAVRSDARANRSAVVAAARKLVATDGADVPLTTIADEAGVGIATLYRNFPTREELFVAVVLDGRDRVHALVDEHRPRVVADAATGWSPFVRALAAVESVLDVVRRAGVVREDASAVRFVVGLGMVTRALPAGAPFDVAGQHEWMIEVYLRGLRP
jgi:AcrR family transcriptional regulator